MMEMTVLRRKTTPSSEELRRESFSLALKPSGFHPVPDAVSADEPSIQSAFSLEAGSPYRLGHLEFFRTTPSRPAPPSALPSSNLTSQDSQTLSTLSLSTLDDTTLQTLSPPSVSFISEFFRAYVPDHRNRQKNLVRGTQAWVSEAAQDLPETMIRSIYIAHYVQFREQSKYQAMPSGEGRRTAAFKVIAKDLSLPLDEVRKGCQRGVNYLLLAQLSGPGSLLLIGKRARTLWEKDIRSEDVTHLLDFRRKHMPYLDIQACKLDGPAIGIISRYVARQGWKGISLVSRLTEHASSELLSPKEHTIELSSNHQKRRQTFPPDRSSKRSAHRSSKDFGSMHLPKAVIHKECRDTFVDPFPQQVGGPEITTYMKTTGENVHLNTWMQDLAPWSVEEPEITAYMTTFNEGGQSNKWMQDLLPWTVDELDITTYMTFVENSQPDTRMQELFLKPLEVPDLTTCMKASEREGCLPSVQAPQQIQTVRHQMLLGQPTEEGMPYEGWMESHQNARPPPAT